MSIVSFDLPKEGEGVAPSKVAVHGAHVAFAHAFRSVEEDGTELFALRLLFQGNQNEQVLTFADSRARNMAYGKIMRAMTGEQPTKRAKRAKMQQENEELVVVEEEEVHEEENGVEEEEEQ